MIIQSIRKGKFGKVLASYLSVQLLLQVVQPTAIWALTGGPSQPEFNSFTPIGTSDMVDLASGDFSYNIPIMDVGGYPLNLSYDSEVTMDQEASWVGLGWNLNVGQIGRSVRGIPDDFKGDRIAYTDESKDNRTIGVSSNLNLAFFGFDKPGLRLGVGISVEHNNYTGVNTSFSLGPSYKLNNGASVGFNLTSSPANGADISPTVSYSKESKEKKKEQTTFNSSVGVTHNSRQGLSSFNLSASLRKTKKVVKTNKKTKKEYTSKDEIGRGSTGISVSFDRPTYTPAKRTSYKNQNYTLNIAAGGEVIGAEAQGQFTGYVSQQSIANSFRSEASFGYEHTDLASKNDILDFNRENDRTITLNTKYLPVTNYTYDLYNIQGQGIAGQFRPFRSQVGFVHDNRVSDNGFSIGAGGEIGGGNLFRAGADVNSTFSYSETGVWKFGNRSYNRFTEEYDNHKDYEKVYYKGIGELSVNDEAIDLLEKKLGGETPVKVELTGLGQASEKYKLDNIDSNFINRQGTFTNENNKGKIKRQHREKRNQSIQKITKKEVIESKDRFITIRNGSPLHHTAGVKILQPGGASYIYGLAAYNMKKVEATFDVSGAPVRTQEDKENGVVTASVKSPRGISDRFLNKIETPPYAHSYLLTSILSQDYEDITDNGISDDDLGSYTKFTYEESTVNSLYKWRIPYDHTKSSFNEGLESLSADQKGNYIYGEKELFYIKKIETKTHVAIFDLREDRKDGLGAVAENVNDRNKSEGNSRGKTRRLHKISLYSKPEYKKLGTNAIPIKQAHFRYDNSLCKGINNSISGNEGKLTLRKVWFTYRNSNMGKYTPYEFSYGNNMDYNAKSYDIWGNYKPFTNTINPVFGPRGELTASEFPYVQQEDRGLQDTYASAWSLDKIQLPSGGEIDLTYESDSYSYVQEKKAMRMFKVLGVGNVKNPNAEGLNGTSVDGSRFVYIALDKEDEEDADFDVNKFKTSYIGEYANKPIYFRFMLNMGHFTSNQYDFVTGYLDLQDGLTDVFINKSLGYAAIPIKSRDLDGGGFASGDQVNPIRKSGLYFGRRYLNNLLYSGDEYTGGDVISIAENLATAINGMKEVFIGPNRSLIVKGVAKYCIPNKSWIRLLNPRKEKLGGGARVKELKMHDNWSSMAGGNHESKFYGQSYTYELTNGDSSGVATFEPNASKENPLVQPAFEGGDRLLAPSSENYTETPIGASFYPSSTVTYSKVKVESLTSTSLGKIVKNHDTGSVVTNFFTSQDFPTLTMQTKLSSDYRAPGIGGLLKVLSRQNLTVSQGFSVVTNDMNGKEKSQEVFAEDAEKPISKVEYFYNTSENNPKALDNKFITIDELGNIEEKIIGVDYDVINDFRRSTATTERAGIRGNLATFLLAILPGATPSIFPEYNLIRSKMFSATTTKVIHKRGILKKKVAHDLGARVATENIAFDANTGSLLVTKTDNEYDDSYYNITYPAYWHYSGMGLASENIGISGNLKPNGGKFFSGDGVEFLQIGDELRTNLSSFRLVDVDNDGNNEKVDSSKLWVIEKTEAGVVLMTAKGYVPNINCSKFSMGELNYTITRSGKRNQQNASMASITSLENPISKDSSGNYNPLFIFTNNNENKIVNASTVQYSDFWEVPNELNLPKLNTSALNHKNNINITQNSQEFKAEGYGFNPYKYNVRGDFRALKSYAFLGSRTQFDQSNLGNSGYIENFKPFYSKSTINAEKWGVNPINLSKWTAASEVTKLSPFGFEIENKDALNRYSSAQYGYNNTLPIAVSSNSAYNEMTFDGFEDYPNTPPNRLNYSYNHFDIPYYKENLDKGNFRLTNNESHSGKSSIMVLPNKSVSINRSIGECEISEPFVKDCFVDGFEVSDFTQTLSNNRSSLNGSFKIKGKPFAPVKLYAEIKILTTTLATMSGIVAVRGTRVFIGKSFRNRNNPNPNNPFTDDFIRESGIGFFLDEKGEMDVTFSLNGRGDCSRVQGSAFINYNAEGYVFFRIPNSTGLPSQNDYISLRANGSQNCY